jgi:dolichol-phosphate mannosyltransferase
LTGAPASARPEVTVIAPLFNERTNVAPLVEALGAALGTAGIDYEVVLVDDGSKDGTWDAIAEISAREPRVRGVALSRNFGHQGALLAGLNHARGRAVVTMDGDLQHPPSVVPVLVQAWRDGFKVVNTRRTDSTDTGGFKRLTSRLFYRIFSRLSGIEMESGASDFRLVDRSALTAMTRMGDADLFIRGIVNWLGFKTKVVPYQAARRHSGATKFTLRRMFRLSAGAMLSFSALPLRLGIGVGFVTSVLAFLELCYILYVYSRGEVVPGWASVMTIMSFMFGILFVLLGVIGTYLGKIYEILKRRPRYVVGERVGFDAEDLESIDRRDG